MRGAPFTQQQPMLRRHSWSTHGLRSALTPLQKAPSQALASPSLPAAPSSNSEAGRHAFAASQSPGHERGGYLTKLATHNEADEVCPLPVALSTSHIQAYYNSEFSLRPTLGL